jgi:homocysteine S-methyltransferase
MRLGLQSKEWYENGARLIGGCCRTTPDHIREVKAWAVKEATNPIS